MVRTRRDGRAGGRLGEVQLFGGLVKTTQAGGGFEATQGVQGRQAPPLGISIHKEFLTAPAEVLGLRLGLPRPVGQAAEGVSALFTGG